RLGWLLLLGRGREPRALELRVLGRVGERGRGCGSGRDREADQVEIAGADLALMARRGVAARFGGELGLLQLAVGAHATRGIVARKLIYAVIEAVEARERHELVLVAHGAELALEARDGRLVDVGAPVERGRAVVGEKLVRELAADRLGECARLLEIGMRGLPPQHVGVARESEPALDAMGKPGAGLEPIESLDRALAGDELAV